MCMSASRNILNLMCQKGLCDVKVFRMFDTLINAISFQFLDIPLKPKNRNV